MSSVMLDILAFVMIITGIFVITSDNPIIAVMFLIGLFLTSACYLLELGVTFVGLSYLIIYVGAITVLFLFVIMMINIKLKEILSIGLEYNKNLPLGLLITCLFIYSMLSITPVSVNFDGLLYLPMNIFDYFNNLMDEKMLTMNVFEKLSIINNNNYLNLSDVNIITLSQVQSLALSLYTKDIILLFVMGVILLLAMVGPIILSMNTTNE